MMLSMLLLLLIMWIIEYFAIGREADEISQSSILFEIDLYGVSIDSQIK